jgi:hypothetical protein
MKRYMGIMFILLVGLAMGFLMSSIMGCGASGSSGGYYGANVYYSSGWGGYYPHRYHHRRPPRVAADNPGIGRIKRCGCL